jgi:hypothetical protein
MPGPWEKYQKGPWEKYKAPAPDDRMDPVNAGIMKFSQGLTSGLGDEIIAGVQAPVLKAMDLYQGGDTSLGSFYDAVRDERRELYKKAQQDQPGVSTASELAGAVTQGIGIPGARVAQGAPAAMRYGVPMAQAGAQGAVGGAGYSEADTLGGVAQDAAVSGALGAGFTGAAKGAGELIAGGARKVGLPELYANLKSKAKDLGKKTLSLAGGVPVPNIQRYIDAPEAVNKVQSADDLGQLAIEQLEALKAKGIEGSRAARKYLPETPIWVGPVQDVIDTARTTAAGRSGPLQKGAVETLDTWRGELNNLVKNQQISPQKLKDFVIDLNNDIDATPPAEFMTPANQAKIALSKNIRGILQGSSPEYTAAMREVAKDFDALTNARGVFGNPKTVASAVERAARNTGEKAGEQARYLEALSQRAGGENILQNAKDRLVQQSFDRSVANGARRTTGGAAVGMTANAIKQAYGDEEFDPAEFASAGVTGGTAGFVSDRYGPAMTKALLDAARAGRLGPVGQGVNNAISAAQQRGPDAVRSATFLLLKQFPQFEQMLEQP